MNCIKTYKAHFMQVLRARQFFLTKFNGKADEFNHAT